MDEFTSDVAMPPDMAPLDSQYYSGSFFDLIGDESNVQETETTPQENSDPYGNDEPSEQDAQEPSVKDQGNDFAFDEYFDVPEEFGSHDEALKWYNDRLNMMKTELMNPENALTRQYIDNYVANRLDEQEELINGFSEAYQALMKNPKEYLIQFVPEVLTQYGIEPMRSPQEIESAVDLKLKQEFGEDYRSRWNANELLETNSFTSQLLSRRNQILSEYEQINQKNGQIVQQWNKNLVEGKSNLEGLQTKSAEEQISQVRAQYKDKFVQEYKMSEESFDTFLKEVSNREVTLEDLHRVQYFEGYMKQAYQKGLEDAKAGLYQKLNSEGNAVKRTASETRNGTPRINDKLRSVLSQKMYIPNY